MTGIVAAEAFSDLRSIATDRAPWLLSGVLLSRAFRVAEARGRFDVASVSPVECRAVVAHSRPADSRRRRRGHATGHSQRILAALPGPKRLVLVPNAGHNQSLNSPAIWDDIDRWLAALVMTQ